MSLELVRVSKAYRTIQGKRHTVFDQFSLSIPRGRNMGVIGRNGAGKSTLLRLLAGAEKPDSGRIMRNMSVSWPLGFTGFFNAEVSGRDNAAFCARLYGRKEKPVIDFVRDWSGLGDFLDWPVKGYSTGMRSRLGLALSLAVRFDCILIDEALSVGDASFRKKARQAIDSLRKSCSFVLVTHNVNEVMENCDYVAVLGGKKPIVSSDVKGLVQQYHFDMTGANMHETPRRNRARKKA